LRRFVPPLLRENLVFRRFWLAQTISLFGDQISLIRNPAAARRRALEQPQDPRARDERGEDEAGAFRARANGQSSP
jgi:hypothetical protein